jgi:hypothetical protein
MYDKNKTLHQKVTFFANILLSNLATRVNTRWYFSFKMGFGHLMQKHYFERKIKVLGAQN